MDTTDNFTTGRRIVRGVALTMVMTSATVILLFISVQGTDGIWQRAIRFALTCALASGLARGASWARWISLVLCTITGIMSIVSGVARLGESLWAYAMLLLGVVYLVAAVMLLVPESVRAFFAASTSSTRQH